MVVGYLDVRGTLSRPAKAHAPLVIDPDAVLPLTVATQSLKPVRWRQTEIRQHDRGDDTLEPHPSPALNLRRQAASSVSTENAFGVFGVLVLEERQGNTLFATISPSDNSAVRTDEHPPWTSGRPPASETWLVTRRTATEYPGCLQLTSLSQHASRNTAAMASGSANAHQAQLTVSRSGTRPNSLLLFVTRVAPMLLA